MKASVIEIIEKRSFDDVFSQVRKNILAQDFLIIHEINTTQILNAHGISIPQLKQLLFFHPRYMVKMLEHEPLAVNDIPLKIVIREIEYGKTSISFSDPILSLSDYNLDQGMLRELNDKIQLIIKF